MGIKSLFKHLLLTTAVLSIYACGGGGGGGGSYSAEVPEEVKNEPVQQPLELQFVDLNFSQCVADLIEENTYVEVEQITQLNCSNYVITELGGIEQLVELEYLDLSNNSIIDISPLKNISKLKIAVLSNN